MTETTLSVPSVVYYILNRNEVYIMNFNNIKQFLSAHSCEIAVGVNIVSTMAAAGLATYGTIKTVDRFNELFDAHVEDEINDKTLKKESVKECIKRYTPVVGCLAISVASLLYTYNNLKAKTAAAIAAAGAVESMYSVYRERVIAKYGEEDDFEFVHGFKKTGNVDVVAATNPDDPQDQTAVPVEEIEFTDDPYKNKYMFWFGPETVDRKLFAYSREINGFILRSKEAYWNTVLHARGDHEPVTLNEILKDLGLDAVDYGQVVGWTDDHGCGYIDFGLCDARANEFFEEKSDGLWLCFNVQGIIIDKYD